jgi:hypothetical protein
MTGKLPDGGDSADHGQHVHEHPPDDPLRNGGLQIGDFHPQVCPQLRDFGLQISLRGDVREDKLGQRLGSAGRLLVGEAGVL